ncbi:MAG: hypothetical protein Ct9H300mP11_21710 [Chloroflexota bacterium]|nr:MAG: hypothetical protein Ct9H300mP11_21710 [Chloroflexota bacterium]
MGPGVKEAIPLLSIAQFIGSVSRAYVHKDTIDWKVVCYFALGSVPVALIASFIFVFIDSTIIVRILGGMLILMVIYSRLPIWQNFHMPIKGFVPIGSATGFISGLFGIPGPFATVFYLSYGLSASAYVGTSSVGYGLIQLPKVLIFGLDGLFYHPVSLNRNRTWDNKHSRGVPGENGSWTNTSQSIHRFDHHDTVSIWCIADRKSLTKL